jgi:hypothetical protein
MLASPALCQIIVSKEKKTAELACDKIMNLFKDSKFSEAIDTLKLYSNIESSGFDNLLATIKQQMNNATPRFGKMLSYEFIKERSIKDFFSRRFYVIKFEKYFLEAYFNLYNNGSGWTITYFGYTQDIEDLF